MTVQPSMEGLEGCTYRQLLEILQQGTTRDQAQTLLASKAALLFQGLDAFGGSTDKGKSSLQGAEHALVVALGTDLDIGLGQCTTLWQQFRKQHVVPSAVLQASPVTASVKYHSTLLAFAAFYYDERLALLSCLQWLLARSLADDEHDAHDETGTLPADLAKDTLLSLDHKTFLPALLSQFTRLTRRGPRAAFRNPAAMRDYAKYTLREERLILEVMLLYTFDVKSYDLATSHLVSHFAEMEANGFGLVQAMQATMQDYHDALFRHVHQLCVIVSVSLLQPIQHVVLRLRNAPDNLVAINSIMAFLGNQHAHGPVLLAWANVLHVLADTEITQPSIKAMLTGQHAITRDHLLPASQRLSSSSSSSLPEQPLVQQQAPLHVRYVERAMISRVFDFINGMFDQRKWLEDPRAHPSRITLYECLHNLIEAVNDQFWPLVPEAFFDLITSLGHLYEHLPEPATEFWESRGCKVILNTLLHDFPDNLDALVRLLTSLASHEASATKVMDCLAQLPGIKTRADAATMYNGNSFQRIQCTPPITLPNDGIHLCPLELPIGSPYTIYNDTDVFVETPVSGWHIIIAKLAQAILVTPSSTTTESSSSLSSSSDPSFFSSIFGPTRSTATANAAATASAAANTYATTVSLMHLVEKMLSHATVAPRWVQHVQTFGERPKDKQEKPTGIALHLLFAIIDHMTAKEEQIPLQLLASCVRSLVLILKNPQLDAQMRNAIWAYIGPSPLFPRPLATHTVLVKTPFTLVPTRQWGDQQPAQLESIIKTIEQEIGDYPLLLAYLDFMDACLQDLDHHWHLMPSAYQVQVLAGFAQYLLNQVLLAYPSWRYRHVIQKHEIGTKVMGMLLHMERHWHGAPALVELRTSLLDLLILDDHMTVACATSLLSAIVHVRPYDNDDAAEITALDKRVLSSLELYKILLQRQWEVLETKKKAKDEKVAVPLLVQALLDDHQDMFGGKKVSYLYSMANLLDRPGDAQMAVLAMDILSLVCTLCNMAHDPPNLVPYFADATQLQRVIQLFLNTASAIDTKPEPVVTAVWQFITTLMASQPSLGLLFLDCSGDTIMPSPKSAVLSSSGAMQPSTSRGEKEKEASSSSAVRVAQTILNDWQRLSVHQPTILSNVLRFLATFWHSASEHYSMVQRIRSDSRFWQHIEAILFNRQFDQGYPFDNDADLLPQCCMNLNRALVLQLIAFEIKLTSAMTRAPQKTSDGLSSGLRTILTKMAEPAKLQWLRDQCKERTMVDSTRIVNELHAHARKVFELMGAKDNDHANEDANLANLTPLVPVAACFGPDQPSAHPYTRQYGPTSFLYDLPVVQQRLDALYTQVDPLRIGTQAVVTPAVFDKQRIRIACDQYISLMAAANSQWSCADTEKKLLDACCMMITTASAQVFDLLWSAQPNKVRDFAVSLLDQLPMDARTPRKMVRGLLGNWVKHATTSDGAAMLVDKLLIAADKPSSSPAPDSAIDECLMLCLVHANAVTPNTLLNVLTASCKRLVHLADHANANTDAAIKDMSIVLALLGQLVDALPATQSLPVLIESNALLRVHILIDRGLYQIKKDIDTQMTANASSIFVSPLAEHALVFLLRLSHIPAATQHLHNQGVMTLLANNALSETLVAGQMDPFLRFNGQNGDHTNTTTSSTSSTSSTTTTQKGKHEQFVERSPLHKLWILKLMIVANFVRHSNDDDMLRCCVLFVQKYARQVERAFDATAGKKETLARGMPPPAEGFASPVMCEVEWLTIILHAMARRWQTIATYDRALFMGFKNYGLRLVARYFQLLNLPNRMQSLLFPVDDEEIALRDNKGTNGLLAITQRRMYRIIRAVLGGLVLLTEATITLNDKDIANQWPFGNIIFAADSNKARAAGTVAFAHVYDWLLHLKDTVNSNTNIDTLVVNNVIEATLLLFVTQIALYIKSPDPNISPDARKVLANDHLKPLLHFVDKLRTNPPLPLNDPLTHFLVHHFFTKTAR
ncbi:hypothetical protein BC940DRAFT_344479 [Gongronella butleri]|nr:hypothetical protein BC940DRAFT_344479 [Gongronella butleri]